MRRSASARKAQKPFPTKRRRNGDVPGVDATARSRPLPPRRPSLDDRSDSCRASFEGKPSASDFALGLRRFPTPDFIGRKPCARPDAKRSAVERSMKTGGRPSALWRSAKEADGQSCRSRPPSNRRAIMGGPPSRAVRHESSYESHPSPGLEPQRSRLFASPQKRRYRLVRAVRPVTRFFSYPRYGDCRLAVLRGGRRSEQERRRR
jgi:hypothetical protein